jgi:hypothetical protein
MPCLRCPSPRAGTGRGGHWSNQSEMFYSNGPVLSPGTACGGGGDADCAAIIQVENSSPHDLANAFLDLGRGFDVPVGTVVVISSASHLGRGGTAAYAGDVVRAAVRIREVYGKNVRVVHRFPLIGGGARGRQHC